jgi:hypothetical protein
MTTTAAPLIALIPLTLSYEAAYLELLTAPFIKAKEEERSMC